MTRIGSTGTDAGRGGTSEVCDQRRQRAYACASGAKTAFPTALPGPRRVIPRRLGNTADELDDRAVTSRASVRFPTVRQRPIRGGLPDAAAPDHRLEVIDGQPAAGHDGDPAGARDRPATGAFRLPSRAVGRPPEVSTRSTPIAIRRSRASRGSRAWSNRLVERDAQRTGQGDQRGGLVAVDRSLGESGRPGRRRRPRAPWPPRCRAA